MFIERLALNSLITTATLSGWSFFQWEEARLRRKFARHRVRTYRASLPNGEVHYWAGGKPGAQPLLLIHGFGADAMWGWAGQIDLARDHFLIAPDLLWFGRSHSSSDDFSSRFQAEAFVQLLDHLAIDQVDVAGISYGGFVGLELAHHHPDRVRKLVMIDSPGHTFTLDDYQELLVRNDIDSIAELIVPEGPADIPRLLDIAYYWPPPLPRFIARDLYAHMFTTWTDQKVRLLDNLLARASEIDPDEYEFHHETLLLWGDKDTLFPPELAHRLARHLGAQAKVEIIRRAKHAPNLERPLVFNRALRSFLTGREAKMQSLFRPIH